MPVAAGGVRDLRMAARRVLAACDMPTERRRATALDRTHHLQLVEADVPAIGLTPSRAVIPEDVRDLQSWLSHGRRRYGAGGSSVFCLARLRRGALRPSRGLSWQSFRSPRDCSGPSSQACRVRAKPESPECPCRARADGSQSCGEANAERPSCAAPRLSRLP